MEVIYKNEHINIFNINDIVFWIEYIKDGFVAHTCTILEVSVKQWKSTYEDGLEKINTRITYKIEDTISKDKCEVNHKCVYGSVEEFLHKMKEQIEFQIKIQS